MSSAKKPKIKYAEIWGLREEKYKWLESHKVKNTKWQTLSPEDPYYFFVPRDRAGWDLYQDFWKVTDIFPVNSIGIVTARDNLTISWSENDVWVTILNFLSIEPERARSAYKLGEDARDWKVELAQEDLKESGPERNCVVPILYRPFDVRYTYYTGKSRGFHCMPRLEVMQHMFRPNLALLAKRQSKLDFSYAFVADKIAESCVFESAYANNTVFPLYLYEQTEVVKEKRNPGVSVMMLFDKPRDGGYKVKRPNINPKLLSNLKNTFGKEPTPEEIFYYIYAVLYSNTYRQKYQEFLKIDFPRVPFTNDYKLFQKLAGLGEGLVDLHLLKSKELQKPLAKFQGRNDNMVERREYKNRRVYINDEQYFEGIKPEVWNYHIGGYQVLDKWLKDRKGRTLSSEDIKHYCRVVTALQKTLDLQRQIDKIYLKVEEIW